MGSDSFFPNGGLKLAGYGCCPNEAGQKYGMAAASIFNNVVDLKHGISAPPALKNGVGTSCGSEYVYSPAQATNVEETIATNGYSADSTVGPSSSNPSKDAECGPKVATKSTVAAGGSNYAVDLLLMPTFVAAPPPSHIHKHSSLDHAAGHGLVASDPTQKLFNQLFSHEHDKPIMRLYLTMG